VSITNTDWPQPLNDNTEKIEAYCETIAHLKRQVRNVSHSAKPNNKQTRKKEQVVKTYLSCLYRYTPWQKRVIRIVKEKNGSMCQIEHEIIFLTSGNMEERVRKLKFAQVVKQRNLMNEDKMLPYFDVVSECWEIIKKKLSLPDTLIIKTEISESLLPELHFHVHRHGPPRSIHRPTRFSDVTVAASTKELR
jgi:hypothetical protein